MSYLEILKQLNVRIEIGTWRGESKSDAWNLEEEIKIGPICVIIFFKNLSFFRNMKINYV